LSTAVDKADRTSHGRSLAGLLVRQVEAIDAWNAALAQRQRALSTAELSRKDRLDAVRRRDVLNHAHEAVLVRARQALNEDRWPPAGTSTTAVIAHRQEWFSAKLRAALVERGVHVVAAVDDGATALGIVVVEQPDLLLVEDQLPMLSGQELVEEAALFAPSTITAGQVAHGDRVGLMLEAGARTAFARQVPPVDVADQLLSLVQARQVEVAAC
jgi:CheY-like chemotaxis protein